MPKKRSKEDEREYKDICGSDRKTAPDAVRYPFGKLRREVELAGALLKQREHRTAEESLQWAEDDPQVPRQLRQSPSSSATGTFPVKYNRPGKRRKLLPGRGGELVSVGAGGNSWNW